MSRISKPPLIAGLGAARAGGQGAVTLMAVRAIIHATWGWPTPFGAALNGSGGAFGEDGDMRDPKAAWQASGVAEQVMEFARMRADR